MKRLTLFFSSVEERFFSFLHRHSINILRISIGVIYLVFGVLKFFPRFSPAEKLASDTICMMTFDLLSGGVACLLLAIIETLIGLALIINFWTRRVIMFALWHMLCTFFPLFLLPEEAFNSDPFSFSIVGQYIFKNLIIISALLVVYHQARLKLQDKKAEE